ncbi:PREDICTED: agamous-like MADS-box protein AGL97 [Camelina sativa]|uniref:Agamous-like MADS-box protein AGL97 n=1 Tax=Camelina sativa TaxID=90675 RepID=A0ABM1QEE9_CAMSA|nr:PREDICTED: agamous-like MADS-box protein AGL97 [Camelina sativa]
MGGLKRKIDTGKKIDGKNPRAVAFSKRRKGLFNKASELCLLSDCQIAISDSAFLADQTPSRDDDDDDEKLGFWWEDESVANSENPEELGAAIDSMTKMLHDLKELQSKQRVPVYVEEKEKAGPSSHITHQRNDLVEVEEKENNNNALSGNVGGSCNQGLEDFDQLIDYAINSDAFNDLPSIDSDLFSDLPSIDSHVTHQEQTLNHQPCSSSLCIDVDDVSVNEEQQTLAVCGTFDVDDQIFDRETRPEVLWENLEMDDDLTVNLQGFQNNSDEEQTLANNDGILGSFNGCNQEFDLDQLYDFVTKSEDLWKDMEMYDDCLY